MVLAGLGLTAVPAHGAISFGRCGADEDLLDEGTAARRCARVSVPLDHTGAVAGRIALHVERVRAPRGWGRSVVVALAGGPGQAAAPYTGEFASIIAPALRTRDLVVFDQRGTGRSGVVRCPSLEQANIVDAVAAAAARCGARLGPRRAFYTTRDSVADLELLRRRLGVPRLTLYGISYGTKVALDYARAHPGRVERLVLDSAFEPEGPDFFLRDSLGAMPRVLRALCARGCPGVSDAAGDLERLAGRLEAGPIRGYVVDARGRRRRASVDVWDLFNLLLAGDLEPSLRTGTPAAVRSALRGDPLSLIRLTIRARRLEGEPPPPRELSVGLYATTTCEEGPVPWARAAEPDERRRQLRAYVAALPAADLAPFGRAFALRPELGLCLRWPSGPQPTPPAPAPLPPVRTIILSGDQDLRTPREGAARVAARVTGSRFVTVRDAGHSVTVADLTGCVGRAVRQFFANRRGPRRCARRAGVFVPAPVVPASLRQLGATRTRLARARATVGAVRLTLADVLANAVSAPRGGGLRGGTYRAAPSGYDDLSESQLEAADSQEEIDALFDDFAAAAYLDVRLDRVVVVRGVRVSGRVRLGLERVRGSVRISGGSAAGGRLRVTGRPGSVTLAGRLGGRRVRQRVELGDAEAFAARAASSRRPVGR